MLETWAFPPLLAWLLGWSLWAKRRKDSEIIIRNRHKRRWIGNPTLASNFLVQWGYRHYIDFTRVGQRNLWSWRHGSFITDAIYRTLEVSGRTIKVLKVPSPKPSVVFESAYLVSQRMHTKNLSTVNIRPMSRTGDRCKPGPRMKCLLHHSLGSVHACLFVMPDVNTLRTLFAFGFGRFRILWHSDQNFPAKAISDDDENLETGLILTPGGYLMIRSTK